MSLAGSWDLDNRSDHGGAISSLIVLLRDLSECIYKSDTNTRATLTQFDKSNTIYKYFLQQDIVL